MVSGHAYETVRDMFGSVDPTKPWQGDSVLNMDVQELRLRERDFNFESTSRLVCVTFTRRNST